MTKEEIKESEKVQENKQLETKEPSEETQEKNEDKKSEDSKEEVSKNKQPPEKRTRNNRRDEVFDKENWQPKTEIGKKVKEGKIIDIAYILDNGLKIMEPEIADALIPNLEKDLLLIGQSKGKFGGGQRRVFRQTQKKTKEGNKPRFSTYAVVGNYDGLIGVGMGKAKETVPAREKSFRNAKLNIIKIRRGCGSWECGCKTPHSIPFSVEGKCGSVKLFLKAAPKGKGLIVEKECQKILKLAGIKDVWSRTEGQTSSKINLIAACMAALKQLNEIKIHPTHKETLGIAEGSIGEIKNE